MRSWQDWIDDAHRKGWKVQWREAVGGYVIITPKAFRRPSVELGCYSDERAAWRGAANLCRLRAPRCLITIHQQ